MQIVSEARLGAVLSALPGGPRIVAGGNVATSWRGHDASVQAEQIIAHVAHPSARPELREAGRSLGFRV